MKIKAYGNIVFTSILVILLCLGSTVYATRVPDANEITNAQGSKLILSQTANSKVSTKISELYQLSTPLEGSDNIVVSNVSGNETYPSMIMSGYNALIAYEYEDNSDTHLYLRTSNKYGETWSNPIQLVVDLDDSHTNIEAISPSLSIRPESKHAFGTFVSTMGGSGIFGYYEIPDITDPSNLEGGTFDWTNISYNSTNGNFYSFWNFKNPDIVAYQDTITPWVISLIGSTNYTNETTGEGPCTDTPMFCFNYLDNGEISTFIVWFPDVEHCSNISFANDYEMTNIYGVCEINNDSKQDLLFFKGNPDDWFNGEQLLNKTFTGAESLLHPQIFVRGNQIYIVAETESNGIILYNSSNGGNTWDMNSVVDYSSNPKYPRIFVNETHIFCSFVGSGNISLSENNGTGWSAPLQLNSVNNSVVEMYRYADMPDMDHVVWTDNREGNYDIYSVVMDSPEINLMIVPDSVSLAGEEGGLSFIPTKNRIKFTVKNTGVGYVEDVDVEITYCCLNKAPQKTKYPGYIGYLDGNDAQIYFDRPLFRMTLAEFLRGLRNFAGIQNITITVDPEGKYTDSNILDNTVTITVGYAEIFPKLAFLEKLFSK